MIISGFQLIGETEIPGAGETFTAFDPVTMEALDPVWANPSSSQIDKAVGLAVEAFPIYRNTDLEIRASFLETIAECILFLGDLLIDRVMQETGLPRARMEGERLRTVNQLRIFARVVREGDWLDARIDHAQPERKPLPKSDIRLRQIAIGPVVVFGSSNFPLAFSVAGGDTASAFAAGCPVIVKGHPAHPGTSELIGKAIRDAVKRCGLPQGVFSLLSGAGNELGMALVSHPGVQAVGFTGSRHGGLALTKAAAKREVPIPVYAEMSSTNPVFLLPGALAARAERMADEFVKSLLGSAGQLCTNPGILVGVDGPSLDRFIARASEGVRNAEPSTMLSRNIADNYNAGVARMLQCEEVDLLARGQIDGGQASCQASLALTHAAAFLSNSKILGEEIFGASSLIIRCEDIDEMLAIANILEGQLTATLHLEADEDDDVAGALISVLETKAGRILANGFPTGVEVCDSMVHGGPFPSTSDSRTTSVGTMAIRRFLRPVCYQDIPNSLLPMVLRADNPWKINRAER